MLRFLSSSNYVSVFWVKISETSENLQMNLVEHKTKSSLNWRAVEEFTNEARRQNYIKIIH